MLMNTAVSIVVKVMMAFLPRDIMTKNSRLFSNVIEDMLEAGSDLLGKSSVMHK
jgi:hypothetical protein